MRLCHPTSHEDVHAFQRVNPKSNFFCIRLFSLEQHAVGVLNAIPDWHITPIGGMWFLPFVSNSLPEGQAI